MSFSYLFFQLCIGFNIREFDVLILRIRIYCSMIGSTDEDVLLMEESDDNVHINIRHTKDFRFVTVNTFSTTSSKVLLCKTVCFEVRIF
jgi:protease II